MEIPKIFELLEQLIIAIELLLEWIEEKESLDLRSMNNHVENNTPDTRLLTAPDVARILNISKGGADRLIQQVNIPSVRFNNNVRVKEEDLDNSISKNRS